MGVEKVKGGDTCVVQYVSVSIRKILDSINVMSPGLAQPTPPA